MKKKAKKNSALAEAVKEAEANDPKHLQGVICDLRAKLAAKPKSDVVLMAALSAQLETLTDRCRTLEQANAEYERWR